MGLEKYQSMRRFDKTPEPKGKVKRTKGDLSFVVQKHDARRLHYDFRLEWDGVLKSFAIPKGPSMNPEDKRLAVPTEDHPLDYASFEGEIPHGHYGAGEVIVWDTGTYQAAGAKTKKENIEALAFGFKKGHLNIELFGKKLKGIFSLIKIHPSEGEKEVWLLVKKDDQYSSQKDITQKSKSIRTGKKLSRDQSLKEVSKNPFPHDLLPMLATLTDEPFSKADWLFEYKYDGYRVIAEIQDNEVALFSRHRKSFDEKFKPITEALKKVKHEAILDGEIVALKEGKMSFEALQNIGQEAAELRYYVFDLLFLDGVDLRQFPLVERKNLLKKLIRKNENGIFYSDHVQKNGVAFFQEIEKEEGEGIMAKKMDSPYQSGRRSKEWLKIKTHQRQEVVVGGFTEPQGSRSFFGALIVGVYDEEGEFIYTGHVGGGFGDKSLKKMASLLKKRIRKTCPFLKKPKTNTRPTWVKPELVIEVKFREWTKEGVMRQPIFLGLREDKAPEEVKREKSKSMKTLVLKKPIKLEKKEESFSNLDKVLWPKLKLTKANLIEYYRKMSPLLLPFLKDRPQSLLRHPHGVEGESFYQKNVSSLNLPVYAETIEVYSESNEGMIKYLICNNEKTLLYMAQLGCLEIHPWNSRKEMLENPDYMIFDIDPGKNEFKQVIKVAQTLKEILDASCEKSYVKTSGKSGLHILVPLGAQYNYDTIKEFSHLIMRLVHQKLPDLTSLERQPKNRGGKIYLDYLQNRSGQTLAAPYSLRATPEATVSTPLEWEEVNEELNPKVFTMLTIEARLKEKGDLWKNFLKNKVDLNKAIKCLREELQESIV